MQPLKSLTFVRIGNANSHKYTVSKKQLRALKTICNTINNEWKLLGIEWNVLDWRANLYDEGWTYFKGVEYFKGQIASKELIDFKDNQENLIDVWKQDNKDLFEKFTKLYKYYNFKDDYHYPPQNRGLYAFPLYRLEPFLTHWDETKFDIKHCKAGTEDESWRRRAKNYITIKYNKPTLWCHFIDEAIELGFDIKINNYWVLVESKNYLKLLALWEKRRLRQQRNEMGKMGANIKHCYQFSSKDDLEVFLVGV